MRAYRRWTGKSTVTFLRPSHEIRNPLRYRYSPCLVREQYTCLRQRRTSLRHQRLLIFAGCAHRDGSGTCAERPCERRGTAMGYAPDGLPSRRRHRVPSSPSSDRRTSREGQFRWGSGRIRPLGIQASLFARLRYQFHTLPSIPFARHSQARQRRQPRVRVRARAREIAEVDMQGRPIPARFAPKALLDCIQSMLLWW